MFTLCKVDHTNSSDFFPRRWFKNWCCSSGEIDCYNHGGSDDRTILFIAHGNLISLQSCHFRSRETGTRRFNWYTVITHPNVYSERREQYWPFLMSNQGMIASSTFLSFPMTYPSICLSPDQWSAQILLRKSERRVRFTFSWESLLLRRFDMFNDPHFSVFECTINRDPRISMMWRLNQSPRSMLCCTGHDHEIKGFVPISKSSSHRKICDSSYYPIFCFFMLTTQFTNVPVVLFKRGHVAPGSGQSMRSSCSDCVFTAKVTSNPSVADTFVLSSEE